MNRQEHLQWSKDRAIEILGKGDVTGAWASFVSDLNKHYDLKNHPRIDLGFMLLASLNIAPIPSMRDFIKNFN